MVESLEVTVTSQVTSLFLEVTVTSSSDEQMVEAMGSLSIRFFFALKTAFIGNKIFYHYHPELLRQDKVDGNEAENIINNN